MAKTKTDPARMELVLAPIADELAPRPMAFNSQALSVADVDLLVAEYEKETAVIAGQAAKTVFAMQQLAELHRHGMLTTRDTIDYMMELDASTMLTDEGQQLFEKARRQQMLMFVDHLHKVLHLGDRNIAAEVDRSLYLKPAVPALPPPAPRRRGIIYRLLFGND